MNLSFRPVEGNPDGDLQIRLVWILLVNALTVSLNKTREKGGCSTPGDLQARIKVGSLLEESFSL